MEKIKVRFWMGNYTFCVILYGSRKWSVSKIEESARICLLTHEFTVEEVLKAPLRSISFDSH